MKIKIHYSFYLLLFIGFFSGVLKEVLIFTMIVMLHELSHLLASLIFCKKVNNITITLIGGVIDLDSNENGLIQEFIINISGILMNLLLIIIIKSFKENYYTKLIYEYNLIMIIFNSLPIYPLDGYRILDLILFNYCNKYKIVKFITYFSFFLSIVFILFGIIKNSIGICIISLFLLYKNIININKREEIFLKKIVAEYKLNI